MAFKIYGAAAVQAPDKVGDVINIEGIDVSRFRIIDDDHESDMFSNLGGITFCKKILKAEDCENDRQKKVFEYAGKFPTLYFEGELAPDHPNARAAFSLIKFANDRSDLQLKVGASIEGAIMKRSGADNKNIQISEAEAVALTVRPCNPRCGVFLTNDLLKSEPQEMFTLPVKYLETLMKSDPMPSFKEKSSVTKIELVKKKIESLKKSIEDYKEGTMTSVKCAGCNECYRFFKNSSDYPNKCRKCGRTFSLSQLWSAANK